MEAFRFLLPAIQKLPDKLERLAVVNDMASYLRVEPGEMLDQFRKSAGDRSLPRAIEVKPDRQLPDHERVLIRLILHHPGVVAGYCDTILGLDALPLMQSHKILETALQMLEADGQLDFPVLQSKLSEADANLLAALFSSDTEDVERTHDDPAAQLRACLEKLAHDSRERQRKELRIQVREAELRGDLGEAMRLMELERKLERTRK
jgi:DNA primase